MNYNNHEEIAQQREFAASKISDMGVYRSVVGNVLQMECNDEEKIDLLLNSVPDFGIIIAQLALHQSSNVISKSRYNELVNQCLLKINKPNNYVAFNPLFLAKTNYGVDK